MAKSPQQQNPAISTIPVVIATAMKTSSVFASAGKIARKMKLLHC